MSTHASRMPFRGLIERSWSCPRCEDRGVVREMVVHPKDEIQRPYLAITRCRCAAGEKQSPAIALCSDAFWNGEAAR